VKRKVEIKKHSHQNYLQQWTQFSSQLVPALNLQNSLSAKRIAYVEVNSQMVCQPEVCQLIEWLITKDLRFNAVHIQGDSTSFHNYPMNRNEPKTVHPFIKIFHMKYKCNLVKLGLWGKDAIPFPSMITSTRLRNAWPSNQLEALVAQWSPHFPTESEQWRTMSHQPSKTS
jgi:hypothetical protein